MEAWSVGKYAKRSCLVHLSSEDASEDKEEKVVLDMTTKYVADSVAAAGRQQSQGPLMILSAVDVGQNATGDALTRLEVVGSTDSTKFSGASTGTALALLKDSTLTLQNSAEAGAVGSLGPGVGAELTVHVESVQASTEANRFFITVVGAGSADVIKSLPVNRADDALPATQKDIFGLRGVVSGGASVEGTGMIPITTIFQGSLDVTGGYTHSADSGTQIGVSPYILAIDKQHSKRFRATSVYGSAAAADQSLNSDILAPYTFDPDNLDDAGSDDNADIDAKIDGIQTILNQNAQHMVLTVKRTPMVNDLLVPADAVTYKFPMVGVNLVDGTPAFQTASSPVQTAIPDTAVAAGRQFVFSVAVQDANSGSYTNAHPLLKDVINMQGTTGGGEPISNDTGAAQNFTGGRLFQPKNGHFFTQNNDQKPGLYKLELGFETSTFVTKATKRMGAADNCDYVVDIPNIVGYPEHKRCLVQMLQASFFAKNMFKENNLDEGGQNLPVMVGVDMSSLAPQQSFSSSVRHSMTEPAQFRNTTMIGYGILEPFGSASNVGTAGESGRINQRLAYGFSSPRGILDEGVLISSPFGSQVRVRFVNLSTHQTLRTDSSESHPSDHTLFTAEDIQNNPTHLILRFLFLDDDEVPMR